MDLLDRFAALCSGFFENYIFSVDTLYLNGKKRNPYMTRWKFLRLPWFGFRVHKIYRSDLDRELHDHPFTFLSLVLSGGYTEETPGGVKTYYGPGSLIYRRATDLHRLELDEPTWTFIIRGQKCREWGFMTQKGWVSHREFIASKDKPNEAIPGVGL